VKAAASLEILRHLESIVYC